MIDRAVILAAGQSSRFWPLNKRHKSLIKVMGRPLIFYTLLSLQEAGIDEVIVVQGKQKDVQEEVKPYLKELEISVRYVTQKEPKGMGNALWQAKDLLNDRFLVLNAERIDAGEIISRFQGQIKELIKEQQSQGILFGKKTNNPNLFGILKVEDERVMGIVEKPSPGREPSDIRVVGIYVLEPRFFSVYEKVEKGVYDFETALSEYIKSNRTGFILLRGKESPSLKYPWHLFNVQDYLFKRYLKRSTAASAKVKKGVSVQGRVYIGEKVRIYKGAVIKGPCYIGDNCIVGNHTLIRENVNIEEGGVVGANSELARSNLQKDVHIHSNFIGDSVLGTGCRVGAGTVTGNVRIDREKVVVEVKEKEINTGLKNLGTVMGEKTKVGINCSLMPGTLIGSRCIIGPHSLVKKNLPDNTIFYNKFENVEGQS